MKKAFWIPVILITALVLSACGAARPPAPSTNGGGGETFMLALPRMVVDVDTAGNPVVFGLNTGMVSRFLGADLSSFRVDPKTVKQMTDANVQHVEMRQVGDAMLVLVNGKPLPHIGWTDSSLQEAMDVAGALNVKNADLYKRLLPLVRRLGLDLVMRFPRQPGAAEIPLGNPDQTVQLSPSSDPASAIVKFEVKYDENGAPSIMGIGGQDLAGMGIKGAGNLSPATLSNLQQHNIQNIELRVKSDGVHVYKNGNPLPTLAWDDALLKNLTDFYAQTNPNDPNLPFMQLLLPWMSKADVDILVHFPVAAGQQPLPAQMHP
jgi:hypothetical protein